MRRPRPIAVLALLAAALIGALPACGPAEPAGNARMAARLAEKTAATDPMGNMYLNAGRLAVLEQQIAEVGGDAAPFGLRARRAEELMLCGRSAEAVAAFDELASAMDGLGQRANPKARAALAHMLTLACLRLGEQSNCIGHHNPESCLMPFEGGGVHVETEGSRRAMELLEERLAEDPEDWEARWLLNLAAMTLGLWPDGVAPAFVLPREAFASAHDPGRFPDVAAAAGVAVTGLAGGVVMDDLDGDGLLDLLVSSWGLSDPLHLLRNDGAGRFADATAGAGLDGLTGGLNMCQADYDNDGDVDVLVLRGAWFEFDGGWPNSLLRNDGHGHFDDVTEEAGLLSFHPTQTAAFGDYDGDGWLDLFIGNETGPQEVHRSELYHNRGDGGFDDVTALCGLAIEHYVKGSVWGDIDDDGDPDLYVSRIDGKNLLLRNDGAADGAAGPGGMARGMDASEAGGAERARAEDPPRRRPAAAARAWRFTDIAADAGVTEPKRSFPTWFFDYDNDGRLDLFVSGFRYGSAGWVCRDVLGLPNKGIKAKLFHNLGGGRFEDVSADAGVEQVLLTMGCNFGDLDNDGFPDFYLSTGEPDYAALYPNRMFRNDGAGHFQDVTTAGGFGNVQKGHGIAFGDLDNDGDQDVYAVMGGAYSGDVYPNSLYLNPGHGARWITLRLEGVEANRSAIGARVRARIVEPGGERDVHALAGSGGSFGGGSLQVELGLGAATSVRELEIRWPGSGRRQVFPDVPLDRVLRVVEGAAAVEVLDLPRLPLGH